MSIADIKAKINAGKYAADGVRDLSLRLVRDFQCPRCRIEDDMRSVLVPIPTASSEGILRCYFCGGDFAAPNRN
jgi:transcription elongation factor Elf1